MATLDKNIQLEDNLYYLTAIDKLLGINKKVEKYLSKYNFSQLSIADMANGVSSDFTPDAAYDRQSAANKVTSIIKDLSGNYKLMLSAANAANASYATVISDAPLSSGSYIFANGVPFYQMVYHGAVDYTGKAVNLSADSTVEFLRCVEYGASLKYTLIYRNREAIKNSDYTYLYSADFGDNIDLAAKNYEKINTLYKKVSDSLMISHKKLEDSIYCTEYENGVKTVVNYSDNEVEGDYGKVPAKDFIIIG